MTPENAKGTPDAKGLGTFAGVFTPTVLTILGAIMYLRLGQVVGNAGMVGVGAAPDAGGEAAAPVALAGVHSVGEDSADGDVQRGGGGWLGGPAGAAEVVVVAGVNLPLLLKVLNYRRGADLDSLADKLLPGAREAIQVLLPADFTDPAAVAGTPGQSQPPCGAGGTHACPHTLPACVCA